MIKLIGILVVILGFVFKVETLFTVLVAGIATGLVAGMDIMDILNTLGQSFVDNRAVSLFIMTLPVIGILERYGLKQRAVYLIQKLGKLTTGGVFSIYMIIRQIAGALSIRISGHPQFVRPLVEPMAQAAAKSKYKNVDVKDEEAIKALSAASENYGNFYGQNLFSGSSGVLLIASTLTGFGYAVSELDIAKASIIMAVIAFLISALQNYLFDKKSNRKYNK
ncbi:membrane protein [Clostridium sp. NCR]|nr:membrane protein [Clostridium sp. NCR]